MSQDLSALARSYDAVLDAATRRKCEDCECSPCDCAPERCPRDCMCGDCVDRAYEEYRDRDLTARLVK